MLQKTKPIRRKKITESAKGEQCTVFSPWCNFDPETTVFAHVNSSVAGKGFGKKSDDIFGCYSCSECHRWLDEGTENKLEKDSYFLNAIIRTQKKLIEKGLMVIK